MSQKKFCPFWNVGFYKYQDKCKIDMLKGTVVATNVTNKYVREDTGSSANLEVNVKIS